jgi:hypothetical protein
LALAALVAGVVAVAAHMVGARLVARGVLAQVVAVAVRTVLIIRQLTQAMAVVGVRALCSLHM